MKEHGIEKLASRKRVPDEKVKTRSILNHAVKFGKIQRPKICPDCLQERKITAHHPDYSKPLDVEWKCYPCHGNK